MSLEQADHNPYPNRRLPVGRLSYPCSFNVNKVSAALEYGEKEILYAVPKIINAPGIYCNLGELFGGSSILMALSIKDSGLDAKVYTVDCDKDNLTRSRKNYERFSVGDLITQYEGTTDGWAGMFQNRDDRFQFVFIDADHSFNNTYNDIMNYRHLLVAGGILGFHDTNQDGVDAAITKAAINNWELIEWVNRIKLFRKPT